MSRRNIFILTIVVIFIFVISTFAMAEKRLKHMEQV